MKAKQRVHLTPDRIRRFNCPADKDQDFLWDDDPNSLAVRVTRTGAKSFTFEAKLHRQTIRITIGSTDEWPLESVWAGKGADRYEQQRGARQEASRLAALVDQGIDPRVDKAERLAAGAAKRSELQRCAAPFSEAWASYIVARTPSWGARHLFDHEVLTRAGGAKWKRGKRKTNAGPLAPFLPRPLAELDAEKVKAWLRDELAERPTQARLAFGALRAFVRWCAETPAYRGIVDPAIFDASTVRALLPRKGAKKDCLAREQLKAWFAAVRAITNPAIAAYLQSLLLTGARRNELSTLRWEGVNFKWSSLTIRDKVEGERTIPLTPYVAALLRDLQGRNVRPLRLPADKKWDPSPWVFASPTAAAGHIAEPRLAHNTACATAGIDGLTLHGLRRSFGTLAEWVECPAGVVAQIMGHKPSATAEKHYRQRPLDLLRLWHQRIEAWMLAEAGIEFDPEQAAPKPEIHAVQTAA